MSLPTLAVCTLIADSEHKTAPTDPDRTTSPETREVPAMQGLAQALCRTRTDDPFLTMEVLYQLS